jgi:hypothetical protein
MKFAFLLMLAILQQSFALSLCSGYHEAKQLNSILNKRNQIGLEFNSDSITIIYNNKRMIAEVKPNRKIREMNCNGLYSDTLIITTKRKKIVLFLFELNQIEGNIIIGQTEWADFKLSMFQVSGFTTY